MGLLKFGTEHASSGANYLLETRYVEKMERILIVDDEEELAFALDVALKMVGYETAVCFRGDEAMERIVDSWAMGYPFSLILTDINMPGMKGSDLIREMRSRGINTPVVAVTGYGEKEMVVELMRLGCDDFVEKPVDVESLIDNIKKILQRRISRTTMERLAVEAARDADIYKRDFQFMRSQMESAVNSYNQLVKFQPDGLKVDLAYRYTPFGSLGGDYFEARNTKDGVEILVADIAGHDIGASYHTIFIKALFDQFAGGENGGSRLMSALNQKFENTFEFGRMATAIHLKLDLKSMSGRVVSAGHSGLILFARGNGISRRHSSDGPALGVSGGSSYVETAFNFDPGDRIFIHTDGLLNASRIDGRTGARKRLAEAGLISFIDSHCNLALHEMVGQVWNDISTFCRRRFDDDALLLAIEIPKEAGHVQR